MNNSNGVDHTKESSEVYQEIDILLKESSLLLASDPKKALALAVNASMLSGSIDYRSGMATSLLKEALCYNVLSDYEKAIEKLTKAQDIAANDPPLYSHILRSFGTVYYNQERYEEALDCSFQSLKINRTLGNRHGESYCLNNIGTIYRDIDNYEQALEYYTKCLHLKEELGDEKTIYNTLCNIATVYSKLEYHKTARDFHYKALQLMRKYNDRNAEANALNSLGLCYRSENDLEKALKYCIKSRDMNRELGNVHIEIKAIINIGLIYIDMERFDDAEISLKEGFELASALKDKNGIANSSCFLGAAYLKKGDHEKAITELHRGLDAAIEIRDLELISNCNDRLAEIYSHLGEPLKTIKYLKESSQAKEKYLTEIIESKTKALMVQFEVDRHQKDAEMNMIKNAELLNAVKKLDKINEEKNNFIGIISHDIRDPVSSICSLSDFIIRDIEDLSKDDMLDFAKDIRHSSEKVIQLLQALLDINAIETGKYNLLPEKLNIGSALEDTIRSFTDKAAAKNINIDFKNVSNLEVMCDRNSAEQIFSNIISNAIKYSPSGRNIYISLLSGEEYVDIMIQDEGPGFTEKDKKKMFEKFAKLSAKPTGGETSTGLGLSIVKQLIEMNFGKIECESDYSKGAKFTISLPVG